MSIAAVVARISRSSTCLPFLSCRFSVGYLPVPDCSFYTVTTCARCYAPRYKSVIQLDVGLFGIHNLGPAALGSVYPVETSTSLYNLYVYDSWQSINWRFSMYNPGPRVLKLALQRKDIHYTAFYACTWT